MKLPHGREIIEFQPLANLYTVYKDHERLTVFANKGRVCVACGRVGTLLVLSRETERGRTSRKRGSVGREHIDLYTDDLVLMTVDHIVPRELGKLLGWEQLEIEELGNKQPMCEPCNGAKGNKLISNEQLAINRKSTKIGAVDYLIPSIHRLLGDDLILNSPEKFVVDTAFQL